MRRLIPLVFLLACEQQPPFVCGPVPELTALVGEWAEADLCFEDPEGAELDLSSFVYDTIPLALVQLTRQGNIRVLGRWPGATVVSVTATDPDGLTAEMRVPVLVPNRLPAGSLGDVEIPARFRETIHLADHFSDPDGQPLYFQASSSAPSVVRALILSDSLLSLTPLEGDGSARISVTVSDGVDSVTTTFEATIVRPVPVLSDEFDSSASLDDWSLTDYARARIEDGYFVLTADSADYNGLAGRDFGGGATDWLIDITLRTTDADAQAGFLVSTGVFPVGAYMFLLGEADIPGYPPVNWVFSWWDSGTGRWLRDHWAYGKSGHIRDFVDMEVSLLMTRSGVHATVDGKLLFEHGRAPFLIPRATGLFLVTRPEFEDDVASSMNRVQFVARGFAENSGRRNVSSGPFPPYSSFSPDCCTTDRSEGSCLPFPHIRPFDPAAAHRDVFSASISAGRPGSWSPSAPSFSPAASTRSIPTSSASSATFLPESSRVATSNPRSPTRRPCGSRYGSGSGHFTGAPPTPASRYPSTVARRW